VYAHPGTIPGWSEYLWILGYSDKGGCVWGVLILVQSRDGQSVSGSRDTLTSGCMPISVQSWDGQSISGCRDTLTRGVVCGLYSSRYNPGMVRVSLDLGIVWRGWMCGVYGHPTTVTGWSEYLRNLRILCHSMASLDIPLLLLQLCDGVAL